MPPAETFCDLSFLLVAYLEKLPTAHSKLVVSFVFARKFSIRFTALDGTTLIAAVGAPRFGDGLRFLNRDLKLGAIGGWRDGSL